MSRQGFLIHPDSEGIRFPLWDSLTLGGYTLERAHTLKCIHHSQGDTHIIVCGLVLDVWQNLACSESIAKSLLQDFAGNYDHLSGSFVIFEISEGKLHCYLDAMGSRPLFYDKTHAASHSAFLAECYGYRQSEWYSELQQQSWWIADQDHFLPGIRTPYDEVYALTPNTMLTLCATADPRISRIFPREADGAKGDPVELGCDFLKRQMSLLASVSPLAISITAGRDSRLALASCAGLEGIKDILFYTIPYHGNAVKDCEAAGHILAEAGLSHKVLPYDPDLKDAAFEREYDRLCSGESTALRRTIAVNLSRTYPLNRLHIKSNGSELFRSYYRHKFALPASISPLLCSRLVCGTDFFRDEFQEWMDVTGVAKSTCGYDIYDLLYWEQRMGRWQGECSLEWMEVQDIVFPFNCRAFLCRMLSASPQSREDNSLIEKMIATLWPGLEAIPFNSHEKKSALRKILHFLNYHLRFIFSA